MFHLVPSGNAVGTRYHHSSIIVYNTNNVCCERYQEIDSKFEGNDIVILIGTGQAACHTHECNSRKMKHHDFREFGYKRFSRKSNYGNEQSMSNKSCGVSIGIRNKTIKAKCIHEVMTPPKPLQGRIGGLRIVNNYYDIAPIGI